METVPLQRRTTRYVASDAAVWSTITSARAKALAAFPLPVARLANEARGQAITPHSCNTASHIGARAESTRVHPASAGG